MPSSDSIEVAGQEIPLWPAGQELRALDEKGVFLRTDFADHALYADDLRAAVEAQLADPAVQSQYSRALGGTKIYRLENWESPAAQLVNARALEAYKRAVKSESGVIDMAWANVYGTGDYVGPHSHIRSNASVVYMLDEGDTDPEDRYSGLFAIIDPRFPPCCKVASGYMTNPFSPKLKGGSMIVFPSSLVHCVYPYGGKRQRITFAWNITQEALEGDTLTLLNQGTAKQDPSGA
jgi:hypothetical protein